MTTDNTKDTTMITTTRRFRQATPYDRDVVILVLTEYIHDEDTGDVTQRVLTEDGWQNFNTWDVLPPNMPHIDGLAMFNQGEMIKQLEAFEERVRKVITE